MDVVVLKLMVAGVWKKGNRTKSIKNGSNKIQIDQRKRFFDLTLRNRIRIKPIIAYENKISPNQIKLCTAPSTSKINNRLRYVLRKPVNLPCAWRVGYKIRLQREKKRAYKI